MQNYGMLTNYFVQFFFHFCHALKQTYQLMLTNHLESYYFYLCIDWKINIWEKKKKKLVLYFLFGIHFGSMISI